MAKITLFGLAGTGTSSVGRALARKLKYQFYSTGNFMRDQADQLGLTIYEFDEMCRKDPNYDLNRDKMIEEFGKKNDNFILDARLGWRFVPDSLKVKLECDFEERVKRVVFRDKMDVEEVKALTIKREESIGDRFWRYYQIKDSGDSSHFDLIIDTTKISATETMDQICQHFNLS